MELFEQVKRKVKEHSTVLAGLGAGLTALGVSYYIYKQFKDPVSYLSSPNDLKSSYDFIVVGAGTSGCVVARRLCEHPSQPSVLLIEAGPPDTYSTLSVQTIPLAVRENQKTEIDYDFYTVPQKNNCNGLNDNKSRWPRGKVMGGSSILNYMVWVRGSPHDYDSWEKLGCKGWGWDNIAKYYKKIENINLNDGIFDKNSNNHNNRGKNGLLSISHSIPNSKASQLFCNGAKYLGYKYNSDYNNGLNEGVSYTQYSIKNGERHSSFRSYISPLFNIFGKCKYNLDILPHSSVIKLNFDNNNNRITSLNFVFKENYNKVYNIKCNYNNGGEAILCCGAVLSPKLLLLSGIGPKDDLDKLNIKCVKNIKGIGNNLQDHVMGAIRISVPKSIPVVNDSNARSLSALFDYAVNGKGWLASTHLDTHVFTHSNAKKKHNLDHKFPDLQLVAVNTGLGDSSDEEEVLLDKYFNYTEFNFDEEKTVPYSEQINSILGLVMVIHPESKGYIKLKSSDPRDDPIIDPNYFDSKYDMDCYLDGVHKLLDIFESPPFKDKGCTVVITKEHEKLLRSDEFWEKEVRKYTHTIYHPVGTVKMGNVIKDSTACVDNTLLVKGINNLRVIDASIMPHLTSGNTQAPCYLIGEKGAHEALKKWESRNNY